MLISAAGDIHGAMDRLHEDVLALEAALGVRFEWVPYVGDFRVWPDPLGEWPERRASWAT